jgi:hypothetical protein
VRKTKFHQNQCKEFKYPKWLNQLTTKMKFELPHR